MSVHLHLGKSSPSGHLGVECFQPLLDLSCELCISSCSFSSPCSIQFPGRTHHRSIQTSYSSGTLLEGGSLTSHSCQHFGRHALLVSYHKGPHDGCLSRLGAQGSTITVFNPLAAHRCVLCRQGFSFLICEAVVGATQESMTKVYLQCWKE